MRQCVVGGGGAKLRCSGDVDRAAAASEDQSVVARCSPIETQRCPGDGDDALSVSESQVVVTDKCCFVTLKHKLSVGQVRVLMRLVCHSRLSCSLIINLLTLANWGKSINLLQNIDLEI